MAIFATYTFGHLQFLYAVSEVGRMVSNLAISTVLTMLILLGVSLLFATVALVLLRFPRKIAAAIVGSVALNFLGLTAWIAAAIYLS